MPAVAISTRAIAAAGAGHARAGSGYRDAARALYQGLRPDVALLAVAGRPNIDGEPYQGSVAQFVLEEVQTLQPGRVAFCHHDVLIPGVMPAVDIEPAAAAITKQASGTGYFAFEYATPLPLFG